MSAGILKTPRKLENADDRAFFVSGAAELDDWFHRFAWQNQRANNAVTYVSTVDDQVVGYYAIASAGVSREQVSERFAKHRPDPIPAVLLARLAVDRRAQGRAVGAALFRDVLQRAFAVSEGLGAAALLIHCRDEKARSFYQHLIDAPQSPVDALQLVVPMKAIAAHLRA